MSNSVYNQGVQPQMYQSVSAQNAAGVQQNTSTSPVQTQPMPQASSQAGYQPVASYPVMTQPNAPRAGVSAVNIQIFNPTAGAPSSSGNMTYPQSSWYGPQGMGLYPYQKLFFTSIEYCGLKALFGNREMAVAREISKVYEECVNGTAAELIEYFSSKEPKGEMVLMIAPADEKDFSTLDIENLMRQKMAEMPLKSAVKEMVAVYGLNKNEMYELALKLKNE